jgi:transcriptional regulator with XRE-family HTH domain
MGSARPKPLRLAEKVREIRLGLGLSQTQMLKQLGQEKSMHYGRISEYEAGKREPSLMTLLEYARLAGVHVEDLIDDEVDLPRALPGKIRHQVKRKSDSRKTKR